MRVIRANLASGAYVSLPDRTLSRIEQELGELFTGTARHELENLTAFTATR